MIRFFARLFGRKKRDFVPYHDFTLGKTVMIPKSELSPGVVLIQIQGQKQPVYADASQLKQGPYQHPPFEGEERAAIQSLVDDLADVYPLTYEKWEDGFRRDGTPAREIAWWIHMTAILKLTSKRFSFSPAEKKECFGLLTACSTGARDSVRNRFDRKLLSDEQLDLTVKYFYEGGYARMPKS